jgi:hypothetical protein
MYVVGKTYTFAATARVGEQEYTVWLELACPDLDDADRVLTGNVLAPFDAYIGEHLHGRPLRNVLGDDATIGSLARHLHGVGRHVVGDRVTAVTAWETSMCWATYRPTVAPALT